MFDFASKWIKDTIQKIIDNANLEKIIRDNIEETYDLFGDTGYVTQCANALKPVGFAMCALFFIMALYDLAMQDRFDLEMFMKFFTKLVGGVGVIIFSNDFIQFGVFGMTSWVNDLLDGISPPPVDVNPELIGSVASGLETIITIGLIALLLQIVFAIISVCITVVCFSRLMEMALRACFMPVALGLVSEDGLKGAGGRYIKRFIALAVQGPALMVIAKIHSNIVGMPLKEFAEEGFSAGGDILTSVVPLLGCSFAAVALCFKSISVINDVFGA